MRYVSRALEPVLQKAARLFPCIVLTGPRRVGKTCLLRRIFPKATYVLMEAPDAVARFQADPVGFLDSLSLPAILDEVQNVPEIFNYVRERIDARPRQVGRWFLTGSQEAGLMRGITESMAGRAAVLHLAPLSVGESSKVEILSGGFPEVLARPAAKDLWFSSYLQTYLERDVRSVLEVQNLGLFRRFLALVASCHGRVLNKTDLAAPLGLSVPGITKWLDVLWVTGQIFLIPPFYENLGKRLIKSPKLYLADSGFACFLLGIRSRRELERSPYLGAIFEGAVAAEIFKRQSNMGRPRELYYFRDQQGLEVDFIVPTGQGRCWLAEAKAAKTVWPDDAKPMRHLAGKLGQKCLGSWILHRAGSLPEGSPVVAPGVKKMDWRRCSDLL